MDLKPKSRTRSARRQQKEKQNMEGGYPMLLDLIANIVDLFGLASSSRHKTYHTSIALCHVWVVALF